MATPTSGSDMEARVRDFVAAWNSRDEERVVALFAEDGVMTIPPLPGTPTVFRGSDEIRGCARMFLPGFRARVTGVQPRGDGARFQATVESEAVRQMGIDALDQDDEIAYRGDKVASFTISFTPESQAKVARAAQQAAGPG